MPVRVAVVGAGVSGLTAVKCCLDEGLEPVCFEREGEIGGLWNYSEDVKPQKANVYKSCVINTSKEMFAYSDFPVPAHFPPFMPHAYVLKYLRMYADHFRLLPYIRFGTSVEAIRKSPRYAETGQWEVVSRPAGEGATVVCERFEAVMVCSGHHVYPSLPVLPGMDVFSGLQLHSHDYRTPEAFVDKKVVVVGIGNSAVDIAVDLSRVTSQVYLSTRRGAWVVGRMGPFGIPMDLLANSRCAFALPRSWLQRMVEVMANHKFDHEAMGLMPQHRVLESHPTINDELPLRILTGSIKVVADLASLTGDSAVFEDGVEEKVDAVIFGTGFDYRCDFLQEETVDFRNNRVDLYKYMFPPHLPHNTLAMIGLVQPVGAFPPVSEIQSRWFTRVAKGISVLPSEGEMLEDIDRKRSYLDETYFQSKKHTCEVREATFRVMALTDCDLTFQTFWIEYMDEIAAQFGARPDLLRLSLKDPFLAARCYLGPCVPAQYRLQGPGMWHGAKTAISRAFTNNTEATRTRKRPAPPPDGRMLYDCLIFLFVVGLVMFMYDLGLFR